MTSQSSFLEMGDEFALQTLPSRGEESRSVVGFVSGRGDICVDFVSGDVVGAVNPPRPHDCRFVVHPTNEYSASKELRKAVGMAGYKESELVVLKEQATLERERNAADRRMRLGNRVAFGAVCQLYCPSSDGYVKAEKRRAREAQFAHAASTFADSDISRSKMPWFRVLPGFAVRTEGEQIRFGDVICAYRRHLLSSLLISSL